MKLKEVNKEYDTLFCVFEYMESNLQQLIADRQHQFSESEIRNWCFQLFQGLAYMHKSGYFHRDLKPENLLVGEKVIKIADFGSARETDSLPPYTEYITTRWYRAPEVILCSRSYNSKVDMWAMGAIMAELINRHPIFPGISDADQMSRICRVIGSPTVDSWADGLKLASDINYKFLQAPRAQEHPEVRLSALIPLASQDTISLIAALCSWDPSKRPSAHEALQHPFFNSVYYIPRPLHYIPDSFAAPSPSAPLTTKVIGPKIGKRHPMSSLLKIPASIESSHGGVESGVEMTSPCQYNFYLFPPESHGNPPIGNNMHHAVYWSPFPPPPSMVVGPRARPWIDKTWLSL